MAPKCGPAELKSPESFESKKAWEDSDQDAIGAAQRGLALPEKEALTVQLSYSNGYSNASQKLAGLAKAARAEAWRVVSMPLHECGSDLQRVAVLTDKAMLQKFLKSKLIVLGSAMVVFPGIDRDPAVIAVMTLPQCRIVSNESSTPKSAAEQITDLMKEVSFLQSGQSFVGAVSHNWRRSWPLQDKSFNMAMSVQASGSFTTNWSGFAVKFFKWREDDVWSRAVAKHFGFPVAGLFAWMASYIRCLWGLAFFGLIFTILEWSLPEEGYDKVRPFFCIAIILFGAAVSEFEDPEQRIIAVGRAHGLEPNTDEGAPAEDQDDEQPVLRAQFIEGRPAWERWARTCVLVPCVTAQFCLIAFVFVCVFWFEMYIIFEWGQCRRINNEHRALHGEHSGFPCRSSDMYRGYWESFGLESLPSITEGILFEALVGISKSMASLVCNQQNWRTEQQYQFAFVVQVFLIEMIGKVGFVCVLAFSFTPRWGMYTDCEESLDSAIFGSSSLSCIKVGVPYLLRKAMLRRAMRGPMLVSMLVGLTIKVLVPKLVTKMVWAARERSSAEKRRRWCWPCKNCGRWLLRVLGLIFIFDCDAVGGLNFVKHKMMHLAAEDSESDLDQERHVSADSSVSDGVGAAALGEGRQPPDQLPRSEVEGALHEGLRKEFTIADEYLEVVLHFTYFSFFGLVWPMGCLFALMNFLLEYRFDVAKLGQVRRRPMPKPDRNLRKLLKTFAVIISMVAIPFNVLMMLLPFEMLTVWFPKFFTETVFADGNEYQEPMDLVDYVPYWLLALVVTSLVLFASSFALRLTLREIRHRDLKSTLSSVRKLPGGVMKSATTRFHGVTPGGPEESRVDAAVTK